MKAQSGYRHVSAFVLVHLPDAIRARDSSRAIIQENCICCHAETVSMVADGGADAARDCFACHRAVAHGERGVSLLPYQVDLPYRQK